MKAMGVLVKEEYNLDNGKRVVIPLKGYIINNEQSFKSGSPAYLRNRNETTWIQQNIHTGLQKNS